jgi:adenylate cyclase
VNLRGKQKLIIGIVLVLVVNAFMAYLLHTGKLYGVQTSADDTMMRNSAQAPDPRIVVVAIDDQSIKDYGRLGQWDRAHYGELIRFLKDAGARVAAFDVYFDPPTPRDPIVADAIAYAQSTAGGTPPMQVILASPADGEKGRVPGQGLAYDEFLKPSPIMLAAKPMLANVTVDPDGAVVRHLPLRAIAGNQSSYLLPFAAVNAYLRRPPLDQEAKLTPDGIFATNRLIPTDSAYRMVVNYEGAPFAFPHPSLSRVVAGDYQPRLFRDKLVFIGEMGATGLADNYPVPTSADTKMDGVEIWANGAQNILTGKFVIPQDEISTILFMLALSGLASLGFFLWGAGGWGAWALLTALYSLGAYFWTVRSLGTPPTTSQLIPLPNIAYIDINLLLSSAALFIVFFVFEQRSRRAINLMFGKYVTPEVAKLLVDMQEQGELALGGKPKTATIMFGDIRGFTTLSEGMEPEEVMGMLNRYFDHMVDIIVSHGGTISKFIGDNVMVMFNLPIESEENHALAAARAGFEIQQWIREYRAEHPEELAAFGFGISSGELVAGNMGSQERMEYTVIGDPVREADELCATALANEVAISESTYAMLKDMGMEVVDKGMVTIKGKAEEIHMYTIAGFVEEAAAVA